jgi:hypothetical protein
MGTFTFVDLDGFTRRLMVEELDSEPDGPTLSRCFTARGRADYPDLLREALMHGDADSLIAELSQRDRMTVTPVNAAERFGGTEFNRYYSRAVCRRALVHGSTASGPTGSMACSGSRPWDPGRRCGARASSVFPWMPDPGAPPGIVVVSPVSQGHR